LRFQTFYYASEAAETRAKQRNDENMAARKNLVISNRSEKSPGEADPPQADSLLPQRALHAGMFRFGAT